MRNHIPIAIAAIVAASASAGFAAEGEAPATGPAPAPVLIAPPNCARWTDDCVNCARNAAGGAPLCSNIGIACQPHAIRCIEPDPPPAEPLK
jgi:hypothetical protein